MVKGLLNNLQFKWLFFYILLLDSPKNMLFFEWNLGVDRWRFLRNNEGRW